MLLPADQKSAGVEGNPPGLRKNADDGRTIGFGPKAPAGDEANWLHAMPGRGFNLIPRRYDPREPWFSQTWQPGDLERVNLACVVSGRGNEWQAARAYH